MAEKKVPLEEKSIEELFFGGVKCVYEIPIYQRNYAWEKDEISALVQDVYDAFTANGKNAEKSPLYYIGTLVTYHKGDNVYEVIDGQQRLTTLRLLLGVLDKGNQPQNRLTYRARKRSDDTLKAIPNFNVEEKDIGIENGYKYAETAIHDYVQDQDRAGFERYFRNNVHIIHYHVPKDIDLNHYFEVMNSRGEQLEKHEIVKANLMQVLENDDERKVFNRIWECCAEMSVYVQQNLADIKAEDIFGEALSGFIPGSFEDILEKYRKNNGENDDAPKAYTLDEIIRSDENGEWEPLKEDDERRDLFLPIIDFPNFLLIVLKITRMEEDSFSPAGFNLDDKELINEFGISKMDAAKVRKFAYNLLKARFFLDNYVVHHSREEDTIENNPWKLQVWYKDEETRKGRLRNLIEKSDDSLQDRLAHLLSMFEVSFTARQRKNYLFYCLLYFMGERVRNVRNYAAFVEGLADKYFNEVYLDSSKLNAINTPLPGSFDEVVLEGRGFRMGRPAAKDGSLFNSVYGDGTEVSKGVPLFVFNYLDYKLWKYYDSEVRGEKLKEGSSERKAFFARLGCSDFGLNVFTQFYFSRTRRSLEHYYPQANATGRDGALDEKQINCFGNYAMIGSDANSSGSNWSPKTKLDHYLDSSGKTSQISVASLKFMVMMQMCKDKQKWMFEEIKDHQEKMVSFLLTNAMQDELRQE